jgi:proteasome accessory factor A
MCETTTMLKVGSAALVLEMIEAGVALRDFTFENPIRAIREISHDTTGRKAVRLAGGGDISALDAQTEYYEKAAAFVANRGTDPVTHQVLDLWRRTLEAVQTQDFTKVDTEIDWVIKKKLIDAYAAKHGLDLTHPRIAQLDLTYHDVRPGRGLHSLLAARGRAARVVTDGQITTAMTVPPQTTRARLRGEFVAAAQDAGRDYTVDWVHLKLNDQAQRTVLLKDPFRATDDRVTKLIEAM